MLEGAAQHLGGLHSGAQYLVAVVGGLDAVDRSAGQVDQRGGPIEMTHPVTQSAGIPLSMMPAAFLRGRIAGDHDHLTADAHKVASQVLAEKSRPTRYHDPACRFHADLVFPVVRWISAREF